MLEEKKNEKFSKQKKFVQNRNKNENWKTTMICAKKQKYLDEKSRHFFGLFEKLFAVLRHTLMG